jgi:hypothetical protein
MVSDGANVEVRGVGMELLQAMSGLEPNIYQATVGPIMVTLCSIAESLSLLTTPRLPFTVR